MFAVGERIPGANNWIAHLQRPKQPVPWFKPKRETAFPDDVLDFGSGDFVAYVRQRQDDGRTLCDSNATCVATVFCKGNYRSGVSMVFCDVNGPTYEVEWSWHDSPTPIGLAKDFRSGIDLGRFDHGDRRPYDRFIERRDGRVIAQSRHQLFDFHGGCVRVRFADAEDRLAMSSSLRPTSPTRLRGTIREAGAVIFWPHCPEIDRQLITAQVLQPSFIDWYHD